MGMPHWATTHSRVSNPQAFWAMPLQWALGPDLTAEPGRLTASLHHCIWQHCYCTSHWLCCMKLVW